MKTMVFANQKGGVGKSALHSQLGHYARAQGLRVLMLDFDHQRNSTRALTKSGRVSVTASASQVMAGQAGAPPRDSFVLVPGDDDLSGMERRPETHNAVANNLKAYLTAASSAFDLCLIDTNPNPDIRYAAALICADYVLSPIQLNQEAIDGIGALLNHKRYGYHRIKAALNPTLTLLGILPNMVEATPFQKANFAQLAAHFANLLISVDGAGRFAYVPKRSVIAEAQAEGLYLAEIRKTAGREAWREIAPAFSALLERMGLLEVEAVDA